MNRQFNTEGKKINEVVDMIENFKGDKKNEENCKKFDDMVVLLKNVVNTQNREYGRWGECTLTVDDPSPNKMNSMAYIDFPNTDGTFLDGENKSLGLAISMADTFTAVVGDSKKLRMSFGIFNTWEQEGVNA